MKKFSFLLIILLAAALQLTLVDFFKIFNIKPDLLLLCMVIAAFNFRFGWVFFYSIVCGGLKDILGTNTLAINSLLFPLWGILVMQLNRKISTEEYHSIRALVIFVITVLNDTFSRIVLLYFGALIPMGVFLRVTFLESLYSAFLSLWVFRLLAKSGFCL